MQSVTHMKSTVRIEPVGYEEEDDIFEDASEQAFINPEEEFYEGGYDLKAKSTQPYSQQDSLRFRFRSAGYTSPQVSN